MKYNNIALYLGVGLTIIAFVSLFICVKENALIGVSIATLLFSIAQIVESQLIALSEISQEQIEAFNKIGKFNMNDANKAFFKYYFRNDDTNHNKKILKVIIIVLNSLAFTVLFLGFVITYQISDKISSMSTLLSGACLFFSMWLIEKDRKRKEQWEEIYMLSLIMDNTENIDK